MSKESKVEQAKRDGRHLRGTIAETLRSDAGQFAGDDVTLLKFHGTYQQDDRDARRRRDESADKAWSFMVRVALPGGARPGACSGRHLPRRDAGDLVEPALDLAPAPPAPLPGVLAGEVPGD